MIIAERRVFFSTLTYELGRRLGVERAARELINQCNRPTRDSLPVARMVARVKSRHETLLYHGASTTLPKARSRAAHEASKSRADFWLMCDDDVECDSAALENMFAIVADPEQLRAAVLPCLLRGTQNDVETVNVEWADSALQSILSRGVRRGGTGMMLLTRGALEAVTELYREELEWDDDDGQRKVALFHTMLLTSPKPGVLASSTASSAFREEWLGEDFSFCERMREAGIEIRAPLVGVSKHAGSVLNLEILGQ